LIDRLEKVSDLPDGQITLRGVAPLSTPSAKNIFLLRLVDTALLIPAVPPRHEGRFAIVTDVECGMRWTRMAPLTNGVIADGEVVWS